MPTRRRSRRFAPAAGDYRQNHGRPGVVYVLENPGLREGWWKIGCSTRSGHHRARDLNDDATTGTPGAFRCIFEFKTLDCGLAEERVFSELAEFRRGKRGQEYFEVGIQLARETIERCCVQVDLEARPAPTPAPQVVSVATADALPPAAGSPVAEPARSLPPIQTVSPQPRHKAQLTSDVPPNRVPHPDRFCGYCRTLVLPKTKLLFFKYCPHCDNPLA